MTSGRPKSLAALVAGLLAAGCGGLARTESAFPVSRSTFSPLGGLPFDSLCAAGTKAPDEVPRLLRPPEPPALPSDETRPKGPGMRGRFGVRAGSLMTLRAENATWSPGVRAGAYYRGGGLASRRMVYELGIDYMSVTGDHGEGATVSSEIYVLRCEVLFGRWASAGRKATFYLLGGGEFGQETRTWEPTGDTAETQGGGVNVGLGVGSPKGSWDARVVYSIFTGSDEAQDGLLVALGFAF